MHSGLCEQYVQSLGLTASGLDFMFRTRIVRTDSSRNGLDLFDHELIGLANICQYYNL